MALRADDVDLGRDRDLVVRSQSGDDGAFEDLYRRYFDRLYRFCLRRVGDPHEAEELTQETFARAYGALPRLAGERRFYPWLSVIASRLCVDEFRRRSRSEPAAVIDLGVGEGGQEVVLQAVDVDLIERAMTRLTPRHRDVLRLREHEGWSYQHIAEHMGVTLGTVEALLHRARRALKREFDVLAGPERVPVAVAGGLVARLARRLQSLRAKVAGCDEAWLPLLGNAVVAAVVVMGTAVGGGASASTPDATLSLVPASYSQVVGGPARASKAADVPSPGHDAPRHAPTATAGRSFRPGDDVGASGVLLENGNGSERPGDQPTVVDVAGITVGADADGAVGEAERTADSWRRGLEEETP